MDRENGSRDIFKKLTILPFLISIASCSIEPDFVASGFLWNVFSMNVSANS